MSEQQPPPSERSTREALVAEDCRRVVEASRADLEGLRGRRLLLTGGTGFFGTWLLEALAVANELLGLDCEVLVLTRDPSRFARKAPHLAGHRAFRFIEGDVRALEPLDQPVHAVIHAATDASAKVNSEAPLEMISTIVDGTRRVLDVARAAGARRVLFVSSGGVYGRQPPELERLSEEFMGGPDPTSPANAYHEAKRLAELWCATYAKVYGLEVPLARCFAFVGPHLPLDAHFAIGNFIGDVLAGRTIVIKGDGTPRRSYQYAADLVRWLFAILARGTSGRAYNVGSDAGLSIAELARVVAAESGTPSQVEVRGRPVPGAKPEAYVPAVDRARRELGLENAVDLPEAIRRTLAWHRAAHRGVPK